MSKYEPEIGDIWWFGGSKKHYLIKTKIPTGDSYKWRYDTLCLEDGTNDSVKHGFMNAHGDGWFRKVA